MTGLHPDERSIFLQAIEIESAAERVAFVDESCAGDLAIRARVHELLAAHDRPIPLLDAPDVVGTTNAPVAEGTLVGPYELLEQIGEGGMGTVYRAQQQEPMKRLVALKVIKAGMDSQQVLTRFEAERQVLALMDHPNIARVHDAGTVHAQRGSSLGAGRPFFVMELVKGIAITKYCDQNHVTPRRRLELLVPVCRAIQHAHQKGIIHRDLKPSNVLVALYDDKPVPKVIDFGVAKAIVEPLTEQTLLTSFGTVVGTVEYMSPEQAGFNQLDVDTRSDIYSLGVLLYELLTGTTPLNPDRAREQGILESLRIVREEEPPTLSNRLSTTAELPAIAANRGIEPAKLKKLVRGELNWIVMKALEKDRDRRYQSASDLGADIERYLDDEPVHAFPPSRWYRLRKFARRHELGLAISTCALITVGALIGSIGWIAGDRMAQRRDTEGQVERALQEAVDAQRNHDRRAEQLAITRAQGLLATGRANERLRRRVEELVTELVRVADLEEIRLRVSDADEDSGDWAEVDRNYAQAFRDWGIDLERLAPAEAAASIQTRSRAAELVAALDDWSRARRYSQRHGDSWRHLLAVARRADHDIFRNQVRDAWEHNDRNTLANLARDSLRHDQPPATLLLLANGLSEVDLRTLAIDVLQSGYSRYPSDYWMIGTLAYFLLTVQPRQPVAAEGFLRAALALRPESPSVRNNLGTALWRQGKLHEAETLFRQAIALRANSATAHNNLGTVLAEQKKFTDAETAQREAIRLRPDYALYHRNLGLTLLNQGLIEESINSIHQALQIQPNSAANYYALGKALTQGGRNDEAIAASRDAIRLDPDHASARVNLGALLTAKGDYENAIREFEEALRRRPGFPGAHLAHGQLASALKKTGQLDAAIDHLKEARRLKPDFIQARIDLGNLLSERSRFAEAILEYRELLKLYPTLAEAHNVHFHLGVACAHRSLWSVAIEEYQKNMRVQPEFTPAYVSLVRLLATCPDPKIRDPQRAVEIAKKAVEIEPQQAPGWRALGMAAYYASDYRLAVEALNQSVVFRKVGPCNDWLYLAMAHWRLDQRDEARKWHRQAIEWMEKNKPDEELRRLRVEAEVVMKQTK